MPCKSCSDYAPMGLHERSGVPYGCCLASIKPTSQVQPDDEILFVIEEYNGGACPKPSTNMTGDH